jgi:bis(5'-nucleosyl)-tetraphosphatase (symmetrical)
VETVLQGPDYKDYLNAMYGNEPARWSRSLKGMDRLRFITNCFTRLRYCDVEGNLALKEKGRPDSVANGYLPWFAVPGRASSSVRIIFGHWSTLGYAAQHNTWALDSGCVWKGRLTAIRVRKKKPIEPISISCAALVQGLGS